MVEEHKSRGFSGLPIDLMINPIMGMFQLFLSVALDVGDEYIAELVLYTL
jgi:hypothetical protein